MKRYLSLSFIILISECKLPELVEYNQRALVTVTKASKTFEFIFNKIREKVSRSNPYKTRRSLIKYRFYSKEEKNRILKRSVKVRENLKKFLNIELPDGKIVNIGIALSGGGYRAMLATLGFLKGLEEENILDLTNYVSTLSGSTWAVASWLSSGLSLGDYYTQLKINLKKGSEIKKGFSKSQLKFLTKNLTAKYVFNQPISTVDLYGSKVINDTLRHMPAPDSLKLSDHKKRLDKENLFLPIYTAVIPNIKNSEINYQWYEINSYVSRNVLTNGYVKTWAFGRKFKHGRSVPEKGSLNEFLYAPELSLANFMGIFGSIFTVSPTELLELINEADANIIVYNILKMLSQEQNTSHMRVFSSPIFNPMYKNIKNKIDSKDLYVNLIDAGIDFNIPLPPLLKPEKKIDLIIIFDMSSDCHLNAPALKRAAHFAKHHNLPMPHIDIKKLNEFEVFRKENAPSLIHIPFFNTCIPEFCYTLNLTYSEHEIEYVFNTAKNIAKKCAPLIKNEIIKTADII